MNSTVNKSDTSYSQDSSNDENDLSDGQKDRFIIPHIMKKRSLETFQVFIDENAELFLFLFFFFILKLSIACHCVFRQMA